MTTDPHISPTTTETQTNITCFSEPRREKENEISAHYSKNDEIEFKYPKQV